MGEYCLSTESLDLYKEIGGFD